MPFPSLPTRASGYGVTAANWNDLVNFLNTLREVAYAEYTTAVACTATTVGTANQIVALGAATYEAVPHMLEFYCPRMGPSGSGASHLILRDGTTVIGTLLDYTSASTPGPAYAARRLTPSAASHNYNVAGWVAAGTCTANAGTGGATGGAGDLLPGFIRAVPLPT